MIPKSVLRIGINLLVLAVVAIPVHVWVAGALFTTEDTLSAATTSLSMFFILVVLIILYAENTLWGFYFASIIAMANFFSIIPTWVYRIEGVIRVDDLALLITVAVILIKAPQTIIQPGKVKTLIAVVLGFIVLQYVYTVLFVGELPWMALRELRAYVHYLWFFLPFYVFKDAGEIIQYLIFIIAGTIVNALTYIPQVLFTVDLGYVITHVIRTIDGSSVGWRVFHGIPDLLLPVLVFFFIAVFIQRRYDIWYVACFLILVLCLFVTHNRTFMMVYPLAVILGIALYMRMEYGHMLRVVALSVVAVVFFFVGLIVASKLLGFENILIARFDTTRETIDDIFFGDAHLVYRFTLLWSVVASVHEMNPLLGLGFIGFETEIARTIGIQYLGAYQFRTNDMGLATIIGHGGWLFVVLKSVLLAWICIGLYRIRVNTSQEFLRILSITLICFIVVQIPVSITFVGLASSQTISTIAIGYACSEMLFRFESERRD